MQHGIPAIKGGFPEGVWLNARFWFLLQGWYLTVVFQDDDDLLLAKIYMNGVRSMATTVHSREAFHGSSGR